MKHSNLIPFLVLLFVVSVSCDDDDTPQVINESEVITTMTITLDAGGGDVVTLTSVDSDGPDGPTAPTNVVVGNLTAGATYSGSIVLLDESDPTDVENITIEVEEEALEHQFFYCATGLDASISGENLDSQGNVLGTAFSLTAGNAGSGTLTFTLLHDGDKTATVDACNVSGTAPEGEIDIEQTFSVDIQ